MYSMYFDIAASGHAIETQSLFMVDNWIIQFMYRELPRFVSQPNEDIHSHPKHVQETPVHTCMDGMEPTEIFEVQNCECVSICFNIEDETNWNCLFCQLNVQIWSLLCRALSLDRRAASYVVGECCVSYAIICQGISYWFYV